MDLSLITLLLLDKYIVPRCISPYPGLVERIRGEHLAKDSDDHAFGSDDTELKLQLVQRYLEAFTQALRRKFKHLWYIDGFAGTGMRTINHPARPGDFMGQEDTPEWTEKRPGQRALRSASSLLSITLSLWTASRSMRRL